MVAEEEGHGDGENLNYFLTLLRHLLFPASFIFSKLHMCVKIGIPTVCRGKGGR